MTKPNKDGWIKHRGKIQPTVEPGTIIDVRYRNGDIDEASEVGEDEEWLHEGSPYDVMAWRPHKPSILNEPGEPNDALKEVLELDAHESEWKAHDGLNCSAPDLSVVEVLLRNGAVLPAHDCERFTWEHSAVDTDRQIMAYRVVDMREPVSYDDDYCDCDCDGPIQWRDRILEIDAASKEEEARHCAAMEAYDKERASLLAKLKAEGFALIQSDEPNGELESAQDDIAQQDMSDPANWRVGDLIECTNGRTKQFTSGNLYLIGYMDNNWVHFYADDSGDENGWHSKHFKWHSRPTT